MLERLLELLFSAKSGIFAGVFLIGTTGALVTATVQNGVTTITITEASPSPSGSASPTDSTASASPSPSPSPSTSPSSSPSDSSSAATSCSDEAHDINAAVQTVNSAYAKYHSDLEKFRKSARTDATRATIENADKLLKEIRQNAVKAIHDTKACAGAKDDDEDNDENDDEDNDEQSSRGDGNFLVVLFSKIFGSNNVTVVNTLASPTPTATASVAPSATPSAAPSGTTVDTSATGDDPQTIADNAVAAMKLVFDTAKADLEAAPTASPRPARTAEQSDRRSGTGKDNGKSHKDDHDDD